MMGILSIQSHVVYGHAGNSAAVFPLQRLGHEVWAINTVEFSNHTGYGEWTGRVLDTALAGELVEGLGKRGVLSKVEAVLSGYMGDAGTGGAVLDAVKRVRAENRGAIYCCDPVMGDVGRGFYVKPGIPDMFKNTIIPIADIVTPNQFELEALTGMDTSNTANVKKAVAELHRMGPKVILVTSFKDGRDTGEPHTGMLVSDGAEMYRIKTPELPFPAIIAGSGDVTTALFLSHYLTTVMYGESGGIRQALEWVTASIYGIMEATYKAGSKELLVIEAQEALVNPNKMFDAYRF
ncbi:MAG: pyridoxal kinase PdxY [Treponema sp.]|jgi:pyridoxine kinase|nr:pyridoxal kinase PdxY [Treponema sp.]